jgi:superfamily II DNA or RNA helicase
MATHTRTGTTDLLSAARRNMHPAGVRSAELDSLLHRLRDAGLLDVAVAELQDELHAPASRVLRNLRTFSRSREIGALLEDAKIHAVYEKLNRDAQIDLFDGLVRWAEDEVEIVGALSARAAPTPVAQEPELVLWAREHEVEAALDRPLSVLAPFLGHGLYYGERLDSRARQTVRDAVVGRAEMMGLSPREQRQAVERYLHQAVAERAAAAARAKRWSKAPDRRGLARLVELLLPLEETLVERAAFAEAAGPPSFDRAQLVVSVKDPLRYRGGVALRLAGHEDGEVELDPDFAPPGLALALVRSVLEAAHDAAHPLHDALADALEEPAWTRMLGAVREALASPPRARDTRLAFVVSTGPEGHPFVEPHQQKRGKRGWSRGHHTRGLGTESTADPRERLAMLAVSGVARYDPGASAMALAALVGHPVVLDVETRAPLEVRRVDAQFAFFEDEEGSLRAGLALGPVRVRADALGVRLRQGLVARVAVDRGLVVVGSIDEELASLLAAAARSPARTEMTNTAAILPIIERVATRVPVALPEPIERAVELAPVALFVRLTPDDETVRVQIRARLAPHVSHPAGEGSSLVSVLVAGAPVLRRRDLALERHEGHALAASLGLPDGELDVRLPDETALLALLDTARARPELELEWPDAAKATRVVGSISKLIVRVSTAREWFGVEGEAEVDGERVKLATLLAAIRSGKRFVKVGPHRFAAIEQDVRKRLERAADVVFVTDKGALSVVAAGGDAVEALADEGELRADAAWKRIRKRLSEPLVDAPLPRLTGKLRDYQRAGFVWLARLASLESGAVLADDMGLGKTVQALALLVHRASEGPALVVTPTSVSDNWVREAARFAPSLRVRLHRGASRHDALEAGPLGPNDVLVASYDVVALDAEKLGKIDLATLVLDEAQWIKNPESQRAKAVRSLSARVRIALTGTPLENRLSELWSIVSTVHPGLLGPWTHFRERFAVPIERDGSEERLRVLAALVRPYLLRRTKEVVAPELPARIELVREVELTPAERKLYDAEREAAVTKLADADERARFDVLASITRLRELACDSELVAPGSGVASSKLAALLEIVDELERAGRSVLVFSQFTRLLHRAAALLDAQKTSYFLLEGSTPAAQRQTLVERFMRREATVFLLSLKAGGTGLNLTAADHVVHLDPWWNPAVEDQASDRAHRIGQDKPVTIVRLVAKGTIEEHVLGLHAQKRALSRGVLDGAALAGTLSAAELVALIQEGSSSAPKPARARGARRG